MMIAAIEKKAVMLPKATEEKSRRSRKPALLISINWLM
jgi:hypothetical protein